VGTRRVRTGVALCGALPLFERSDMGHKDWLERFRAAWAKDTDDHSCGEEGSCTEESCNHSKPMSGADWVDWLVKWWSDEPDDEWVRYTVRGPDPFPIDMLRFDRAWPAETDDSAVIQVSIEFPTGSTEVHLVSDKRPTVGRWESFGWSVEGP